MFGLKTYLPTLSLSVKFDFEKQITLTHTLFYGTGEFMNAMKFSSIPEG